MHIYISRLTAGTTQADIRRIFSPYGTVSVSQVRHVMETTGARLAPGFAFVNIPQQEGLAAVAALNGTELLGSIIAVCEAG